MLEKVVARLLNKVLGEIVEDLDVDQVQVGLLSGKATLRSLRLRRDAVAALLGLPVEVVQGVIGSVSLSIPFRNLRSRPCEIVISDVTAIVGPSTDVARPPGKHGLCSDGACLMCPHPPSVCVLAPCAVASAVSPSLSPALSERVKAQVKKEAAARVAKTEALRQLEQRSGGGSEAGDDGDAEVMSPMSPSAALKGKAKVKDQSLVESIVANVLANMQLTVRKLHLRYEDELAEWGGERNKFVAGGVIVQELCLLSTNSRWSPEFVRDADVLYKVLSVTGLSVYIDDTRARRTPAGSVMSAAVTSSTSTASSATSGPVAVSARNASTMTHSYVLAPVAMSARLTLCTKVVMHLLCHVGGHSVLRLLLLLLLLLLVVVVATVVVVTAAVGTWQLWWGLLLFSVL
jgi:vacuolar protein sorting-associated protein 13A/C